MSTRRCFISDTAGPVRLLQRQITIALDGSWIRAVWRCACAPSAYAAQVHRGQLRLSTRSQEAKMNTPVCDPSRIKRTVHLIGPIAGSLHHAAGGIRPIFVLTRCRAAIVRRT
jgi:hypothetical protein